MAEYVVAGGARLQGSIEVSGAKNAILPIMAASLLTGGTSVISAVPQLQDVLMMREVLEYLGAKVLLEDKTIVIEGAGVAPTAVGEQLMRQLRASNLVMGALLSRFKQVKVAYPGGCDVGSRPMDLHLKGFASLGAAISEKHGFIEAVAERLQGTEIHLDFPSVGATENLMVAATLAQGVTTIRNAAREPEIIDLQNYLNKLGAKIKGAGLDVIKIEGVNRLNSCEYFLIPDRIEAGTHMLAAAITQGDLLLTNVIPEHVAPVSAKLKEAGAEVVAQGDTIRVRSRKRLNSVDCKTLPYPGFPTDMQPQFMALMTVADGTSIITESIFENRFKHVGELRRMGAHIKLEGKATIIEGVAGLSGAVVEATDLRAGASLLLSGFAADNTTIIKNIHHLDRGYEKLDEKYRAVGAKITRRSS